MATRGGAGHVLRGAFLACGALVAVGCGGNIDNGEYGAGAGSSGSGPALGWSMRDDTPYSRTGHVAVLDEVGDRMIVFGGGGVDTWALALSGPNANQWRQLGVGGEYPPPSEPSFAQTLSAVYDPFGQRLIALLSNPSQFKQAKLWQLSLSGVPAWRELRPAGPSPGAEAAYGQLVLDRDGKRLLMVGGGERDSGTWSLSLAGPAAWSRIGAGPPVSATTTGPEGAPLVLDAPRRRLVVFGSSSGSGALGAARVWTMSLATGVWTEQGIGPCGGDFGVTTTPDSDNERVIFLGGRCGLATFSLATGEWQRSKGAFPGRSFASSIEDRQRQRILYFSGWPFGGIARQVAFNSTWRLPLDSLQLSLLTPNTRGAGAGEETAVWDAEREAVLALGDAHGSPRTVVHGLGARDAWDNLSPASARSPAPGSKAIYDPERHAVIAFGGSSNVTRLDAAANSTWEILAVPNGPTAREGHLAIYDSGQRRLVVHAGQRTTGERLDDTWALSLSGTPIWTKLEASGNSPGKRSAEVGVYDPARQRLIVFGGRTKSENEASDPGELHSLTLDDSPTWSKLDAAGFGPRHALVRSAVYDPKGRRMIVLDGRELFALDLAGEPAWHRFCEAGLPLPISSAFFLGGSRSTDLVLVPDGLFLSIGDGAFRFDLDTPYCE